MTVTGPACTALLLLIAVGPVAAADPTPNVIATVVPVPDPAPPDRSGLYLGHTRVEGERKVPILGRLVTRTDTWVVASIQQQDGGLVVEQSPCQLDIKPVLGVRVELDEASVPLLPAARFHLRPDLTPDADHALHGAPWKTGWGPEDLDGDGSPGVTMRVRSTLCGGTLAVASDTTSEAWARWDGDALVGRLKVQVEQRILDASGACLRAAAKDSIEHVAGSFRYTPLPPGSTCADLPPQQP